MAAPDQRGRVHAPSQRHLPAHLRGKCATLGHTDLRHRTLGGVRGRGSMLGGRGGSQAAPPGTPARESYAENVEPYLTGEGCTQHPGVCTTRCYFMTRCDCMTRCDYMRSAVI
eukprot:862508-Pyramimonas_sp.AAC.3